MNDIKSGFKGAKILLRFGVFNKRNPTVVGAERSSELHSILHTVGL